MSLKLRGGLVAAGLLVAQLLASAHAGPADELITAAYRDDASGITSMLLRGVDPNARDEKGNSALDVALRELSLKAVSSLLVSPALDLNAPNPHGETAMMLAALKGRLDLVKQLYKKGARINMKEGSWTPLHYAASGPDEGVSAWLIQQGADINARSPNGSTPLMMAAKYGPYDLAAALVKLGADPSLRNEQNLLAADFATSAGRDPLAAQLAQVTASKRTAN